jgi:LacI family transcriptional regulator
MPTIADVAKLAGVSTGTVSRVMNGSENVSPETRTKVTQAINTLGYEPNFQARSLRRNRTDMIALAMPELANYFWTSIARGVQDAAQAKGYHVLICNTGGRHNNYLRYLELMANRVDGMVLSRRSERAVIVGEQQPVDVREKPVVFVGQSQAASWNVDNVYSDSISGAFALTEHLIRLGHRNIAIVTGRQSSASASDRVAGYCMALADAKLPIDPQRIWWGEYDRKTAARLTHDLMERLPAITAIVAANNEIAIGVIQALEKMHLPVPQSVAVVCFDDFYPDSRFATMMTVASQSPYDIGLNAAQLLLNRLNGNDYLRPQTIVLPARLIVRQSCGGQPALPDEHNAFDNVQGELIKPLPRKKLVALASAVGSVIQVVLPVTDDPLMPSGKNQVSGLKQALCCEAVTPVPHFEYGITSRALYRYVLEREPDYEMTGQIARISPEDQIEFAQRTGIAAIPCRFPHQYLPAQSDGAWSKEGVLPSFDFPLLTDQLDLFDRYVRAARNTGVAIAADFRGIVTDTLRIMEMWGSVNQGIHSGLLQKVADELLYYQMKVVQLICDRFGAELAFVMFNDPLLADATGLCLPEDIFEAVFSPRFQRLIRPAKEHGLSVALHTGGKLEAIISLIQGLGFDAVYIAQPELNDLSALKRAAQGGLSLMGGIPVSALAQPEQVREVSAALAAGGGYIAGVSGEVNDEVSITNYLSLTGALSAGKY